MAQLPKKVDSAAEIDRLALALAKEPGSKAFIPLAEEYAKASRWQEAAAVLEDGLKAYPNFITAMVALGRAYEQLGQSVKAKAILEEAVKVSPDNLRAHRTLAKLYAAEGAKDAALRSCQVILAANPQDQEALSLRAGLMQASVDMPRQASEKLENGPSLQANSSSPLELAPERTITHVEEFHVQPSAHLTIRQQEPVLETGGNKSDSVPTTRATVVRLEQWLHRIQTRRRDHHRTMEPRA